MTIGLSKWGAYTKMENFKLWTDYNSLEAKELIK